MFVTGFIFGFTAGIFVVGVFAPWLVRDTAERLGEELEKLEEEKD